MIRVSGLALSFAAIFTIAGGHWCCLQIAAWSGMLITYSQQSGIVEGVAQTFDGKHPCTLCNAVKAGSEKDGKVPVNLREELKKAFTAPADSSAAWLSWTRQEFFLFDATWFTWTAEPIVPPPRV